MRISFNNNGCYSFCGDRKTNNNSKKTSTLVREVGDIERTVVKSFPAVKPTYPLETWKTLDARISNDEYWRRDCFYYKYYPMVNSMREQYSDGVNDNVEYCHRICDAVRDKKLANCFELQQILMAALIANGYEDVYKTEPFFKVDFYNENGNYISGRTVGIDHTFVTLKPDKNRHDFKKSIVVDAWLNKTMPVCEASNEYQRIFVSGKEDKYFEKILDEIPNGSPLKYKIQDAIDNKRYKISVSFINNEYFLESEKQQVAKDVRENYPELIVRKDNMD